MHESNKKGRYPRPKARSYRDLLYQPPIIATDSYSGRHAGMVNMDVNGAEQKKEVQAKKPLYKRKWFIVAAAIFLIGGAFSSASGDSEGEQPPEDPEVGIEEPAEEVSAVDLAMESDVETREDSIGKSHGDFSEVTTSSPRVRK